MDGQEAIGYVAGTLTMLSVVPQLRKVWVTRDVSSISVVMVVVLLLGLGLWVVYGLVKQAWPIIITNGISFVLYCFLLAFVYRERTRST